MSIKIFITIFSTCAINNSGCSAQLGKRSAKQQGVGMVEVLIALFLFGISVVGLMSLQVTSMGTLSNSKSITVASINASSMAERMRANPQGVANGNYNGITGSETKPTCTTNCTAAQISQRDAYEIKQQLNDELPGANFTVTATNDSMYTINVDWQERVKDTTETKVHTFTFLPYTP